MRIFKNFLIIFVAIFLSFVFAQNVGEIYADMFDDHGFGVAAAGLAGIPMIYIFLIALSFITFGDTKKYWWMGISLIPAAFVIFYLDWYHWYFWLAVGFLGWLVGFGVQKLLARSGK